MFSEEEIVRVLGLLKEKRKYPALPGEVRTALGADKTKKTLEKLKKILRTMGKNGTLIPCQKGRYRAYLLGGEDIRYAGKLDLKLKFELLEEISSLKAELLELRFRPQQGSISESFRAQPMAGEDHRSLDGEVVKTIRQIASRKGARTVDLWEVRKALSNIPSEDLDRSLERLGMSWEIELQPVQDSTKLTEKQREAILRVSDGTIVCAVACDTD